MAVNNEVAALQSDCYYIEFLCIVIVLFKMMKRILTCIIEQLVTISVC